MEIVSVGADTLVGEIDRQVIQDYQRAFFDHQTNQGDVNADMTMFEIERYFKSKWFKILHPSLDGLEMLAGLKYKCAALWGEKQLKRRGRKKKKK